MGEISVKDVLKKLNRQREEEDKIKIAEDYGKEYFSKDVISTGSAYLNYKINKEIDKGGIVKGAFNMYIGGEGSGKTSMALIAASEEQKETGKYVLFYDGEGSLNDSYLRRFNIDESKFIYYKGRNLEDMLDTVEELSKAKDIGLIIIDSIPVFKSTVVEEKSAGDNTIGIEAKKWTERFAIIEGNAMRRNIGLLGLSFYKMNPGAMGDPRVLPRGEWQRYASNLSIEFTKKDLIRDENKRIIGHIIDVRLKKSKLNPYDAKDPFQLRFYYDIGFDNYEEQTSILIEEGIVKRAGAYYKFPDINGEEQTVQGKLSVSEYFKDNPETFEFLLSN